MTLTTLEGPAASFDGLKLNIGPWAQANKAKKIQKQAMLIGAYGAATGNKGLMMLGAGRYMQGRSKLKGAKRQIRTITDVAKVGAVVAGGFLLAPALGVGAAASGAGAAASGAGAAGASGAGAAAAGAGSAVTGSSFLSTITSGAGSLIAKVGGSKLFETVAGKGLELLTGGAQGAQSSGAMDAFSAMPQQAQIMPETIAEAAKEFLPQYSQEIDQARSIYDQYQQAQQVAQYPQPAQNVNQATETQSRDVQMADVSASPWYANPYVIIPGVVGVGIVGYALTRKGK